MCNRQNPDPITYYKNLLPEWGQAADEINENYHFLDLALKQTDRLLIPEEALQRLTDLKQLLIRTIVRLIQDLPPTTDRLSDEKSESVRRFNAHTTTLKAINLQTDTIFEELLQQYPSLKTWFDSTTEE